MWLLISLGSRCTKHILTCLARGSVSAKNSMTRISSRVSNNVTVTLGISAVEYHERRAKLAKSLPRGGVAILPSADIKTRSGAVFYEFHQQPDFFYLTGESMCGGA